MGASNFGRVQLCTNLWTFGIDGEADDEYICQDTISNVKAELNAHKNDNIFGNNGASYEGYTQIGHINVDYYNTAGKYWDSNEYYIVVEYGYHEGGRFDIIAHEDGYFSEIYINNAYNKRLKKLVNECEIIFKKYTTPMVRVGGFSDGTSIYEPIK